MSRQDEGSYSTSFIANTQLSFTESFLNAWCFPFDIAPDCFSDRVTKEDAGLREAVTSCGHMARVLRYRGYLNGQL